MQLPVLGTPNEIWKTVCIIKQAGGSCRLKDLTESDPDHLMDHRKLQAYLSLGFIEKQKGYITNTSLGNRLAATTNESEREVVFGEVLKDNVQYRQTLHHMMDYCANDNITLQNIYAIWEKLLYDDLYTYSKQSVNGKATFFLRLCDAAGLGRFELGRKGITTYIHVNRSKFTQFIQDTENEIVQEKSIPQDIDSQMELSCDNQELKLTIPFMDNRHAYLLMPRDATKEDAQFILNFLELVFKRKYHIE